ncbi:MAG: hypothetical protein K6F76_04430 [Clostridiales bacterium]|nr:hypothetical protein [Clostridiales bacterium]
MEEKTVSENTAEDINSNDKNESKLSSTLPKVLICAAVTVAVVLVLHLLFGIFSINSQVNDNHNVLVYDYETLGYYGLSGGKISENQISGDISSAKEAISGDVSAVLTGGGTLYLYSDNNFLTVDENVLDFLLSSKGNAIVYSTKDKKLNLFCLNESKGYEVAQNADLGYIVSPNGNYAAYTVTNAAGIKETYIFDKAAQTKAFEKYIPVCISDNGEIYAYDPQNDTLYYKNSTEAVVINEKTDEGFFVNENCDQIMFCSEEKMYISENGSEARRISSNKVSLITPHGHAAATVNSNTIFVGVGTLFDCLYYDGANNIFKLTSSYDEQQSRYSTIRLNTFYENYYLNKDSSRVYYIDDNSSLCSSRIKENPDINTISDNVNVFYVSNNEKKVAYITNDRKLYVYQNGQSFFVSENADLVQIGENNTVFYLSNNALYKFVSGTPELVAENVQSLYCKPDGMYFTCSTDELLSAVYCGNEKDGYNMTSGEGELYIINN